MDEFVGDIKLMGTGFDATNYRPLRCAAYSSQVRFMFSYSTLTNTLAWRKAGTRQGSSSFYASYIQLLTRGVADVLCFILVRMRNHFL